MGDRWLVGSRLDLLSGCQAPSLMSAAPSSASFPDNASQVLRLGEMIGGLLLHMDIQPQGSLTAGNKPAMTSELDLGYLIPP